MLDAAEKRSPAPVEDIVALSGLGKDEKFHAFAAHGARKIKPSRYRRLQEGALNKHLVCTRRLNDTRKPVKAASKDSERVWSALATQMASSFASNVDSCDDLLRTAAAQVAFIKKNFSNRDGVKNANSEASRALRELDRLIATMNAQSRNAAPSQRRGMLESLERVKGEVAKARSDLQQANDAASRADLLGGAAGASSKSGPSKAEMDNRERAIRTTETAARGTAKLEQARATLMETEDIGINVVDSLEQQRETILRTRDKAEDVNTLTDRARGIVRGIQRRAFTNQFILGESSEEASKGRQRAQKSKREAQKPKDDLLTFFLLFLSLSLQPRRS